VVVVRAVSSGDVNPSSTDNNADSEQEESDTPVLLGRRRMKSRRQARAPALDSTAQILLRFMKPFGGD
jgi:hypothetical protein